MRRQQVLASQIGDDALFGPPFSQVSFHQAECISSSTLHLGTFASDRAEIMICYDHMQRDPQKNVLLALTTDLDRPIC